ncbi:MAG: PHP domain-containing protein [Deltaproteobacteria bacterium]|nr:PHP domain-containing protein [Deltaproteobacteria bacterium]TLN01658.1 MAG: PHP domain-containing protein [bacterium]
MKNFVDLHIHTVHSDGCYTPAQIVMMAAEKGLKAIAIADHDSVSGIEEAKVMGVQLGIEVVPAVELSIGFRDYHDIHLLGYYINHQDKTFATKLSEFRKARDLRGKAIVEKINGKLASERKASISYDELIDSSQESLGRLHIARLLVQRGYARTVQDAFVRYLLPCNVPKRYFPLQEALAEIVRLGGVSVLAHPQSVSDDRRVLNSLIREMKQMGLDGLEVFNNLCFKDDMIFLESLCRELDLAMTGGSDFHGFEDDVQIGIGRGALAVAYHLLEPLKSMSSSRTRI